MRSLKSGQTNILLNLVQGDLPPALLLAATVFFNAALALVNAHVMPLGRVHVILFEMMIAAAVVGLCALRFRREMAPWVVLGGAIVALHLLLSIGNQSFDPKLIRDVLLIPVFIMLGMLFGGGNIVRLLLYIHATIFAVMLFEGAAPQLFGDVFNVANYYLNTREFSAEQFWNAESTLFISAERPHDRFLLPFLGIHRLSSVFLEPVSFGNYCIIATLLVCTFWSRMSWRVRAFLSVTTLLMLVGCDGRLALVTSAMIVPLSLLARRLPRYANILYLPATVAIAAIIVAAFDLQRGDDFPGRLAVSMHLLGTADLQLILGFNAARATRMVDSGITYFISTQSLIGAALLWTAISFGLPQRTLAARIFIHGACTYIALTLLVSYSLFSIKTAALLWFVYGMLRIEQSLWPVPAKQPANLSLAIARSPALAQTQAVYDPPSAPATPMAHLGRLVAIARSGVLPQPVGAAIQLLVFSLQGQAAVAAARKSDFESAGNGGIWTIKHNALWQSYGIPLPAAAWSAVEDAMANSPSNKWLFSQVTANGHISHVSPAALARTLRRMPGKRIGAEDIRETFKLYVQSELMLPAERANIILDSKRRGLGRGARRNGVDAVERRIMESWSVAIEEAVKVALDVNPNLHDREWLMAVTQSRRSYA